MTPREWASRLWATVRRTRSDRDLEDELTVHLELAADQERRRGNPEGSVVRTARLRVGAVAQAMEAQRDQRGLGWLEDLARDVRFACRTLRQAPGFTAVAVLTLALGTGANSAMFSVINAVLLRPLPFPSSERLAAVASIDLRATAGASGSASWPDFFDWRSSARTFEHLSAYRETGFTLVDGGRAVHVPGAVVTSDLLSTLGVKPALRGLDQVTIDGVVVAFTAAMGGVSALIFGLIPAFQTARPDSAIGGAARATQGRGQRRLRGALVIAETAIGVVLLVGAGLLLRSFDRLLRTAPGFEPEHLVTATFRLPDSRYRYPKQILFYDELLSDLRALPGIESAAATAPLPLSGSRYSISFLQPGGQRPQSEHPSAGTVSWRTASRSARVSSGFVWRSARVLGKCSGWCCAAPWRSSPPD